MNAAAAARDLSQRFAECRALGHSWKHRGVLGVDDSHERFRRPFGFHTGMVGYLSQCAVCTTERMRWITRSGETIPRYLHPDGYSRHGEEVLTSRQWRTQFVASVFEQFTDHPSTRETTNGNHPAGQSSGRSDPRLRQVG